MKALLTVTLSFVAIVSGLIFVLSTICAFGAPDYGFLLFAFIALAALIGSILLIRKIKSTE